MKQIEFDTELQDKPFLILPQEVAAQLPKSGHAKVFPHLTNVLSHCLIRLVALTVAAREHNRSGSKTSLVSGPH